MYNIDDFFLSKVAFPEMTCWLPMLVSVWQLQWWLGHGWTCLNFMSTATVCRNPTVTVVLALGA